MPRLGEEHKGSPPCLDIIDADRFGCPLKARCLISATYHNVSSCHTCPRVGRGSPRAAAERHIVGGVPGAPMSRRMKSGNDATTARLMTQSTKTRLNSQEKAPMSARPERRGERRETSARPRRRERRGPAAIDTKKGRLLARRSSGPAAPRLKASPGAMPNAPKQTRPLSPPSQGPLQRAATGAGTPAMVNKPTTRRCCRRLPVRLPSGGRARAGAIAAWKQYVHCAVSLFAVMRAPAYKQMSAIPA